MTNNNKLKIFFLTVFTKCRSPDTRTQHFHCQVTMSNSCLSVNFLVIIVKLLPEVAILCTCSINCTIFEHKYIYTTLTIVAMTFILSIKTYSNPIYKCHTNFSRPTPLNITKRQHMVQAVPHETFTL